MRDIFAGAAAVLLLAACGGSSAPTADGPGEHDGAHGSAASATCSPSGSSLSVSADNLEFDTDCLAVPAGEAFTVEFDNQEDLPHNFAILPVSGKGKPLFDTGVFSGPAKRTLEGGGLEAGTYPFHCVVHPNMVGSFVVK